MAFFLHCDEFPQGQTLHLVHQDFSSVKQQTTFFKHLKRKLFLNVSNQLPKESQSR